jgi:xanthine dehydrogenase YagS FAD-binding subunit
MRPFAFSRATDQHDATAIVGAKGQFIAGGTTLIDLMKLNVISAPQLVDINRIGLNTVEESESIVKIGALVSNTDLAYNEIILREFPVLSQAVLAGASVQLRNMATVGGNNLQRTRCYYFRDTALPCNKREPGSGCPAIEGYNRIHAVLGTSDQCVATHPSDMCVALVMLDTTINVSGPAGERKILFADFHKLPGNSPNIESVLLPGELIVGIEVSKSDLGKNSSYLKVRDRQSFSFALASAAVALKIDRGLISQARIGLGGVATKPWRAKEAEEALLGKPANKESFKMAANKALEAAKPLKYNGFKIELAKRTLVRALEQAGARS